MSTSSIKRPVLDWWAQYMTDGTTFPNLASLKSKAHGGDSGTVSEFLEVRNNIRNGLGPSLYPVGTTLTVPHAVYGDITFDVADHNHHKKPGDNSAPTMTLVMSKGIPSIPFDIREAAYAVTKDQHPGGLPAGDYYFNLGNRSYEYGNSGKWYYLNFTTTKPVPVGGQIYITNWGIPGYDQISSSSCTIATYSAPDSESAIESGLTLDWRKKGTSLGTISLSALPNGYVNTWQRIRIGNNSWKESHIRQWLNSSSMSGRWWKPANPFGRKASPFATMDGFLKGLDSGFVKSLGFVDVVTRTNNIYENDNQQGANTYTTHDRFFLLSRDEAGFGTEEIAQGSVLAVFDGVENEARIKYSIMDPTQKIDWTLRSPDPAYTECIRYVSTSGGILRRSAYSLSGIVPACVIY